MAPARDQHPARALFLVISAASPAPLHPFRQGTLSRGGPRLRTPRGTGSPFPRCLALKTGRLPAICPRSRGEPVPGGRGSADVCSTQQTTPPTSHPSLGPPEDGGAGGKAPGFRVPPPRLLRARAGQTLREQKRRRRETPPTLRERRREQLTREGFGGRGSEGGPGRGSGVPAAGGQRAGSTPCSRAGWRYWPVPRKRRRRRRSQTAEWSRHPDARHLPGLRFLHLSGAMRTPTAPRAGPGVRGGFKHRGKEEPGKTRLHRPGPAGRQGGPCFTLRVFKLIKARGAAAPRQAGGLAADGGGSPGVF